MSQPDRLAADPVPVNLAEGKDELNLAEFPLCALAHRLHPEQKTLRFEDQVRDQERGETITRQLTITGSDAYGLPTALDDEVLLGLIQLSKLNQFAERTVPFTRYQLIQVLGWRNETKSYERLEASLNRWTGVTLYYQRPWWNKAEQSWVDEKFHVLENVRLFHRERSQRPSSAGSPLSTFVWNEVIFKSFCHGNLKSLDFDFFRELESAIAKRLYRFLDKRFFHHKRCEFDLKNFAWEHAGLSRQYDSGNLKRKLRPGIEELERRGFLRPMALAERFKKVKCGDWRVVFEKAGRPRSEGIDSAPAQVLTGALIARGVTPGTAASTVRQFPAQRIRAQLEIFDWYVTRQASQVSRNPPGFLISSIQSEYAPPQGFVSCAEEAKRQKTAADHQQRLEKRQREQETAALAKERARAEGIHGFWQRLSAEERAQAETEALAQAHPFQRQVVQRGGTLGDATKEAILDAYAWNLAKTSQAGR